MLKYGICFLPLLLLCDCTTNVQSNPSRTATEELLISTAAERAADKLALQIPDAANVFVDNANFEGTDSKYAIGSIRTDLLKRGIHLVEDRKKADVIIETRSGALSIDRKTFLIGIPQFNVPVPFSSGPIPFPEVALYGTEEQKGIAKFAVTGYDPKTGALVAAQDPQYGFSHNTKKTVLIFISWTDNDTLPEGVEEGDSPKKTKPHVEINKDGYAPPQGEAASSSSSPSAPLSVPAFSR